MARNAALLHQRDKRINARFNELYNVGLKDAEGRVIRMRYEDVITQLSGEFHLMPSTIANALKNPKPEPVVVVRRTIKNKTVKTK